MCLDSNCIGGEKAMKNFFVKMIDGIGEERLNDFFKSKKNHSYFGIY